MRTRWWLWVVFLVLGACSKPKERVLSVHFGMSFDDLMTQDPILVEEIRHEIKKVTGIRYSAPFKRLELRDARDGTPFLELHDVDVGLAFFSDWVVDATARRRGATHEEMRRLLRAIQASGLPCEARVDNTWSLESLEREAPCTSAASGLGMLGSVLRCSTSFEDMRLRLNLSVSCGDTVAPSSAPMLNYNLDYGFLYYDAIRWLRSRHEAKYGPLGVDTPRDYSPAETFELSRRPGFDMERYRNEGDAYLREFSGDKP